MGGADSEAEMSRTETDGKKNGLRYWKLIHSNSKNAGNREELSYGNSHLVYV